MLDSRRPPLQLTKPVCISRFTSLRRTLPAGRRAQHAVKALVDRNGFVHISDAERAGPTTLNEGQAAESRIVRSEVRVRKSIIGPSLNWDGCFPTAHSAAATNKIGKHLQVFVRENNVDQALRILKKKMQREGIFREMKRRKAYEKPSERKTREKAEAIRRARKAARKQAQREGLIPTPKRPDDTRARLGGRGRFPAGAGGQRKPGEASTSTR